MTKVSIEKIHAKNWRCFDNFELTLNHTTHIQGDNETGKSTIASAITWVLNGTDILGNVLNDVLPINAGNDVEASVTLYINMSKDNTKNKTVLISKAYKPTHNRRQEYMEHKTIYSINGIEMIQKKYNEWLNDNICDMAVLNILCNTQGFTEYIKDKTGEPKWQTQRKLISTIIQEKCNELEMVKEEKYSLIVEGVTKHGKATDYLKELTNKYKSNERELTAINVKIKTLEEQLATYDEEEYKRYLELESQGAFAKKEDEAHLSNKILTIKQDIELNNLHCQKLENDTKLKEQEVEFLKREVETLRVRYKELHTAYTEEPSICPTCKQPTNKKIKLELLDKRQAELATLITQGKVAKEKLEKIEEDLEILKKDNATHIKTKEIENEKLKAKLEEITAPTQDKKTTNDDIIRFQDMQLIIKDNRKINMHIDLQKNALKSISAELSKLQQLSDICHDFIVEYNMQIEQKANELFKDKDISFKLFKINKTNKEIKDTFEIYFKDKRYENQLSLSTRILVSIWITQVLQDNFNLSIPLIVDNLESVNYDLILPQQAILLERIEEKCTCGQSYGRKTKNNVWICSSCNTEVVKKINVKT